MRERYGHIHDRRVVVVSMCIQEEKMHVHLLERIKHFDYWFKIVHGNILVLFMIQNKCMKLVGLKSQHNSWPQTLIPKENVVNAAILSHFTAKNNI